jgi:predicted DNA-binding protein (UPF0251 family)
MMRTPPRRVITPRPEISLYRGRTIGLLRRYFRMSMELGRMPSVISRDFFRAKVTSYRVTSFEDVVILVHDVEQCILRLDDGSREAIARVVLQEYTHDEAARLLHVPRRTLTDRVMSALDQLSEEFLRLGLLSTQLQKNAQRARAESCQEGDDSDIRASTRAEKK